VALTNRANRRLNRLFLEETDSRALRLAARVWHKLFRIQWFVEVELRLDSAIVPDFAESVPLYPPADRFWADPFIIPRQDGYYVFMEECPYATDKGHIVVLELSRTGEFRGCRPVLERPYHLSYPFLFEWRGDLYMIPESSQNRTVELYRCQSFPDQWVFDRVLLEDVNAYDPTLLEHEGRWWMFLTMARDGQSHHEHLHLFHADNPLGPYRPHVGNPVKSDLRGARPAGALFRQGGVLYRPTQDCARMYGEAVVLQRVEVLNETSYRETEVGEIAPGWRTNVLGVHTLNSGDGLRVVDALRWVPRNIFAPSQS
jgi:hypothetical protein